MLSEQTKEMELLKREEILEYVEHPVQGNEISITGKIEELQYMGENSEGIFYKATLTIKRNTGVQDKIPVIIPKQATGVLENLNVLLDRYVNIIGEIRTMNYQDNEGKKHTFLFVYAVKLKLYKSDYERYKNIVNLTGVIFKKPVYRITPNGKEITDVIIAVKSGVRQSSYIFCIAWREYAQIAKEFEVGTKIMVYGYIHARQYIKKISADYTERHTAYEVSIKSFREDE